jgi:hypothetical protein
MCPQVAASWEMDHAPDVGSGWSDTFSQKVRVVDVVDCGLKDVYICHIMVTFIVLLKLCCRLKMLNLKTVVVSPRCPLQSAVI